MGVTRSARLAPAVLCPVQDPHLSPKPGLIEALGLVALIRCCTSRPKRLAARPFKAKDTRPTTLNSTNLIHAHATSCGASFERLVERVDVHIRTELESLSKGSFRRLGPWTRKTASSTFSSWLPTYGSQSRPCTRGVTDTWARLRSGLVDTSDTAGKTSLAGSPTRPMVLGVAGASP